jgi:hypothetical protein
MHGSNRIPARIDRHEPGFAPGVSHLIASQELLADRVESRISDIRIQSSRIAMPDIHVGIG